MSSTRSMCYPHSPEHNSGTEGAKHLGEALKIKKTLTDLKYASAFSGPMLNAAKFARCRYVVGRRSQFVIAPYLALAGFRVRKLMQKVPSTSVRLLRFQMNNSRISVMCAPG
jgi:hypothetical protein